MAIVSSNQTPDRGGQRFTPLTNSSSGQTDPLLAELEKLLAEDALGSTLSNPSAGNTALFGQGNVNGMGSPVFSTSLVSPNTLNGNFNLLSNNSNSGVPDLLGFNTGNNLLFGNNSSNLGTTGGLFNTGTAGMSNNMFGFNFPGVEDNSLTDLGVDSLGMDTLGIDSLDISSSQGDFVSSFDEIPVFDDGGDVSMSTEPTISRRSFVEESPDEVPVERTPRPAPSPVAETPRPAPSPAAETPRPAPSPAAETPRPAPSPAAETPQPSPSPAAQTPQPSPSPAAQKKEAPKTSEAIQGNALSASSAKVNDQPGLNPTNNPSPGSSTPDKLSGASKLASAPSNSAVPSPTSSAVASKKTSPTPPTAAKATPTPPPNTPKSPPPPAAAKK
jgi:hypothetical protein